MLSTHPPDGSENSKKNVVCLRGVTHKVVLVNTHTIGCLGHVLILFIHVLKSVGSYFLLYLMQKIKGITIMRPCQNVKIHPFYLLSLQKVCSSGQFLLSEEFSRSVKSTEYTIVQKDTTKNNYAEVNRGTVCSK